MRLAAYRALSCSCPIGNHFVYAISRVDDLIAAYAKAKDTDLDQNEKGNMRVEARERDVTGPIGLVPLPLADEGYTLCNVTNDRRMKIDGRGAYERQCLYVRVEQQILFQHLRALYPIPSNEHAASECMGACISSDCRGQNVSAFVSWPCFHKSRATSSV